MLELAQNHKRPTADAGERQGALDGIAGSIAAPGPTVVNVVAPKARVVLRGGEAARMAFSAALGLILPDRVGQVTESAEHAILCLGPDEWLVIAGLDDSVLADLCDTDGPGSAVDIGHREIGLRVEGRFAATLINAGCPLDLDVSSFPAGACTRTLCGKAEVVLWRQSAEQFHIEVMRSFAAYLWAFLEQAASGVPPLPVSL